MQTAPTISIIYISFIIHQIPIIPLPSSSLTLSCPDCGFPCILPPQGVCPIIISILILIHSILSILLLGSLPMVERGEGWGSNLCVKRLISQCVKNIRNQHHDCHTQKWHNVLTMMITVTSTLALQSGATTKDSAHAAPHIQFKLHQFSLIWARTLVLARAVIYWCVIIAQPWCYH